MEDLEELPIQISFSNFDVFSQILTILTPDTLSFVEPRSMRCFTGTSKHFHNLSLAAPVGSTGLLTAVGKGENQKFPENKVSVIDLETEEIIGSIDFTFNKNDKTNKIYGIYSAHQYLFIVLINKILMFELINLSLVYCFEDINPLPFFTSISFSSIKLIVSYISELNPHIVKIAKIRETKRGPKISLRYLSTDFYEGTGGLLVSPKARYVAVCSKNGKRINIYSTRTYKIKKILENQDGLIRYMTFDNDSKYLAILTSNKVINIYSLFPGKSVPKKKTLYKSMKQEKSRLVGPLKSFSESIISTSEISTDKNSQNDGIIKYIKHKMGSLSSEPYCHIKEKRIFNNQIICMFFAHKQILTVLDITGHFFEIKINSKKGELYTVVRNGMLDNDIEL